jgi:hypothetical protein
MPPCRDGVFQKMMQVNSKQEIKSVTSSTALDEFILQLSTVYDNILLMVPTDNAPVCCLATIRETFPTGLFDMWLWLTDPNEERPNALAFGSMHIIGLLLAMTTQNADQSLCASNLAADTGSLFFPVAAPYNEMTLQQLQDHLEAFQWCWQDCLEYHSVETLHAHLTACFAQFGWLCVSARPEKMFGGSMFMENSSHSGLFFVSAAAMRTNLVLFYILFRILHLYTASAATSEVVANVSNTSVRQHHVEASVDNFNSLSMYYDLPPAALACYKDQFKEFYNAISQVVYKYFPDYTRKTQLTLTEINEHWPVIPAIACATQIYPEIQVYTEDDVLPYIPGDIPCNIAGQEAAPPTKATWNWIIIGGNVFLLNSNGSCIHAEKCLHGVRQCFAEYEARQV